MRNVVLYCPHLDRDIRGILGKVPDPMILTGYPTERGHDGCLEMHKQAVREADAAEAPAVFVMEDDCEFTPAFDWAKWLVDAFWAEIHGYDAMVGGCVQTYDPKVVKWGDAERKNGSGFVVSNWKKDDDMRGLIEVSAFHSAHCIVYFRSGFQKVLKAVQPYDLSLGHDCDMKTVMTWPFVAVQRPSFSGILQHDVDYVPLYQQYEHLLGCSLGLVK